MLAATVISPLNVTDTFGFLCACGQVIPPWEQLALISSTDYASLDWPVFLRLAEHHGILPLVARSLMNYSRRLPEDVAQGLRSSYEANLRKNLWFAAELTRIVGQLEKAGIRAIAYKGPVLAESAYGDLGLRSFSDLDLLVSAADFTKAKHALADLAYHPSQTVTPAIERFFLRKGYERAFDGEAGKNLLELQWSLLPHFYAVNFAAADFTIDHLMARARPMAVCGREVLGLSPEDSLLALCLHAAKHLWTRLIWIVDIAQSLGLQNRDSPAIDMRIVIARAETMGIRRMVAISLWLANRLLGTTFPKEAQPLIAEDSEVAKYGEQCVSRISRGETYNFESAAYFKEIAELRERRTDRLRYLWRLVWTPGPGDIAAVNLPEALFPLYHGVRVVRLLRRLA